MFPKGSSGTRRASARLNSEFHEALSRQARSPSGLGLPKSSLLTGPAPAARALENQCWCQRGRDWSPLSAGPGVERKVRDGMLVMPFES
jgi:hypothetical protein